MSVDTAGRARTIVYVHGIGNKPEADILKCQWDTALFGFDLGERSRLAYWVNRAYYPEPSPGTCASRDLTEGEAGAQGIGALAVGSLEEELDREFGDLGAQERRTLLQIAQRMKASQPRGIAAKDVERLVLPLPKPIRDWITQRLTRAFLRDVHDLLYVEERRRRMCEITLDRLRVGGGPFVVVGHSQGSLIAYLVLCELAKKHPDIEVPLFVTIGSPLGIREVQDRLETFTGQKKLAVPACVGRWINVADRLDPVAIDRRLKNDFTPTRGVHVEDEPKRNPDSPKHPHSGSGYLQTEPVRTAVREAVDTALFQPVAPFVIAREVARDFERSEPEDRHKVLIELSEVAADGDGVELDERRARVVAQILALSGKPENDDDLQLERLQRYVAARLTRKEAEGLASTVAIRGQASAQHRIWRNAAKRALLEDSVHTVQAFPAHTAYQAMGEGVTWAILDSGIEPSHPHFQTHGSVKAMFDCTKSGKFIEGSAPDGHGHGTHVAGIVAGAWDPSGAKPIHGIAPLAGLHVYRVLDQDGFGDDAWIIKALDHIASTNEKAGTLVIHGINLSLGGGFDQSSYACGHSPLCRELRRLWRQGVLVVVAAGNEGFAVLESIDGPLAANIDLSIGDPANLEEAISVGSTHKQNPHSYGISYFSSRGPTADGRQKPDCVAPGERILSCRHKFPKTKQDRDKLYVEMSGTSMATPHVSGVLAAFLSKRREFIGQPERVKEILLANCTDLARDRPMQGAGMPNLLRMLAGT